MSEEGRIDNAQATGLGLRTYAMSAGAESTIQDNTRSGQYLMVRMT